MYDHAAVLKEDVTNAIEKAIEAGMTLQEVTEIVKPLIGDNAILPTFKWFEPFTITQVNTGEKWTRATKSGAIAVANNIARRRNQKAVVTLTETGWQEYVAEPVENQNA